MNQTKMMRADEIANGFNTTLERQYWRASIAGSRVNPEVHFNSRSSMVRVSYRIASSNFTVTFSRASASFGDFLASAYRSMEQVLTALKASGLPFSMPLGVTALRIQYDPRTKDHIVYVACEDDDWLNSETMLFKAPQREIEQISETALDDV